MDSSLRVLTFRKQTDVTASLEETKKYDKFEESFNFCETSNSHRTDLSEHRFSKNRKSLHSIQAQQINIRREKSELNIQTKNVSRAPNTPMTAESFSLSRIEQGSPELQEFFVEGQTGFSSNSLLHQKQANVLESMSFGELATGNSDKIPPGRSSKMIIRSNSLAPLISETPGADSQPKESGFQFTKTNIKLGRNTVADNLEPLSSPKFMDLTPDSQTGRCDLAPIPEFPSSRGRTMPESNRSRTGNYIGNYAEEIRNQTQANVVPVVAEAINIANIVRGQTGTQRVPTVQINSPNLNQIDIQRTPPNLRRFYEPEVKIFLAKLLGFFLTIVLGSLTVLGILNSIVSYEILVGLSSVCLIYLALIDVLWKKNVIGILWAETDEIYKTIDASNAILILSWIYLNQGGVVRKAVFAVIPTVISFLIYLVCSRAALNKKIYRAVLRGLILAQVLLITMKMDKTISWGWPEVLIVSDLYFGSLFISWLKNARSHFLLIFQGDDSERKMKIIGFLWYLLYDGLALVALLAMLSVSEAFSPSKYFGLLRFTSYLGIAWGSLLFLFTLLAKRSLKNFIITFGRIESHLATSEVNRRVSRVSIKIDVERKEEFFVMTSSTYFVPLDKSLKMKNQDTIKRIKEIVNVIKCMGSKAREMLLKTRKEGNDNTIDVEQLKEYKEHLDKVSCEWFDENKSRNKQKEPAKSLDASAVDIVQTEEKLTINSEDKTNFKLALSSDYRFEVQKMKNISRDTQKVEEEEENLCHLCYTNPPNAIFMNCGHGGICYTCAETLIKKKVECIECRRKVERIYKVDQKLKLGDIVKSFEVAKITIENE